MKTPVVFLVLAWSLHCAQPLTDNNHNHNNNHNSHESEVVGVNGTHAGAVLGVFTPALLLRGIPGDHVGEACARTMGVYVAGLNASMSWAFRMWDATGRQGSGYLWGNTLWMGSRMECDNMADSAPFHVGFYVLKFTLTLPARAQAQVLYGACLPMACTLQDVQAMATLGLRLQGLQGVAGVAGMKTPHQWYSVWEDRVFWTLVITTLVAAVALACGTAFDFYLGYRQRRRPRSGGDTVTESLEVPSVCGRVPNHNNDTKDIVAHRQPYEKNLQQSFVLLIKQICQQTPGILSRILLSFSVKLNMQTICERQVGSDTIPTIHGLRFLSMVWVVLGHTCIITFKYADNTEYRKQVEKEFLFQTISNATYSVDTFFFISGLLVAFLYFRTVDKIDVTKITRVTGVLSDVLQFIGLLVYRYLRLTVPYLFVLGVVQIFMKWFHFNSVFDPPTLDHENCPNFWWRNALYINTLFPVGEMCMLWSWYLADDTQFYVLGLVLLILAKSHFRVSAAIMAVFLVSSWCTTAFIAYDNEHMPSKDDPFALFDKIYDKPWTRLGPYLIGMCTGWLLYRTDCTLPMSRLTVAVGWLLSLACLLFLIYGLYTVHLQPVVAAAYSSLSHSAWALALAWIVVACSTGHGGYVNRLLSMSIVYPFSRVTYCAYLVHPLLIRLLPMTQDSPMHLSKETVLVLFLGQLVASYAVAFVLSLTYEAPMVTMLKLAAPPKNTPATFPHATP